jgi:hypothetical protein
MLAFLNQNGLDPKGRWSCSPGSALGEEGRSQFFQFLCDLWLKSENYKPRNTLQVCALRFASAMNFHSQGGLGSYQIRTGNPVVFRPA